MSGEKLPINIKIIDRSYPLKIDIKEEERIRKAAKLINNKVAQYQQRYNNKDIQDFLAMAALQFVTKVLDYEERMDVSAIIEDVKDINSEISAYIDEQKSS